MASWSTRIQTLLTRFLLGFALISIGFAAGKHAAGPKAGAGADAGAPIPATTNAPSPAVCVYYMHATFRCVTCNTIETMTRDLLQSEFSADLASGRLQVTDVDFQQNEALAQRYEVAASCVVVTRQEDGRETGYRRLDEVWTLMKDPPAFNRYVGDAIRGYLAANGKATP